MSIYDTREGVRLVMIQQKKGPLESLGTVSRRAGLGDGARGLQCGW